MTSELSIYDPTAGGMPAQKWDEIMLFHDRFYRDQDAHMRWAEAAKKGVDYFEGRQWSAVNMAKLTREGVPFEAITVVDEGEPKPPGSWVTRKAFLRTYPDVRSFPFVVED